MFDFGVTASVCSIFIRFASLLVLYILSNDEHAKVKMPSLEEYETYKNVISSKYNTQEINYAMDDGLNLYLQKSGDRIIQHMFYNGWKSYHYVSNILVFSPASKVIACGLNAPGCMHDSVIVEFSGVYTKLENFHENYGRKVVVDSAFCRTSFALLVKSPQDETS